MIIRSIFVGVALLVGSMASAENIQRDFPVLASQVPLRLQQLGYSNFGKLNLQNLVDFINSGAVSVSFVDNVRTLNKDCRMSAHWEAANGVTSVKVNPVWWAKYPLQKSVLALHENIGPFGFVDEYYWMSITMWFLSLDKTQRLLNSGVLDIRYRAAMENYIAKNANLAYQKTRVAGGAIGTGGGGEGAEIWIHMTSMLRQLDTLEQYPDPNNPKHIEAIQSIDHDMGSHLMVSWGICK